MPQQPKSNTRGNLTTNPAINDMLHQLPSSNLENVLPLLQAAITLSTQSVKQHFNHTSCGASHCNASVQASHGQHVFPGHNPLPLINPT